MQRIHFTSDGKGEVNINNIDDIKPYFKYPDLTVQTVFLSKTIQESIQKDLSEELLFLERYDELKRGLLQLVDMPDKRVNDIIVFMHQNKGIFPMRRKKHFAEITEEEFKEMERMYRETFSK